MRTGKVGEWGLHLGGGVEICESGRCGADGRVSYL